MLVLFLSKIMMHPKVPLTASAYLYVEAKCLHFEKISDISASAGAITAKDEGSNLATNVASFDFVGDGVTATTSGNDVTVTIAAGGISYSRRANITTMQHL